MNHCWIYKKVNAEGYGVQRIAGASRSVGRFMLAVRSGLDIRSVNQNVHACHNTLICPNRACCNPRHLYWGTKKENRADRERDRRDAAALPYWYDSMFTLLTLKHIAEHANTRKVCAVSASS